MTARAMDQAAGGKYFVGSSGALVDNYVLGDMTETVYPVGGGLEDWAYAAGWDREPDATLAECTPVTEPDLPDDFFTNE